MILHDDSVSVLLRSPNSAAKARVLFPGSKTKGTLHRLRKKRILLSPKFMGIVCWLAAANFPRHRYLHTPAQIRTGQKSPPAYPGAFIPPLYHSYSTLSQGVHMHITLKSQELLAIKNAQTREFCPVYQTCASRTVRFMSPTANSWGIQNSPEIIRKYPSPTPLKRGGTVCRPVLAAVNFLA